MWEYFGLLGHQGGLALGYPLPPPSTGRPSNQMIYDAKKRKMTKNYQKDFSDRFSMS